jgi:preprotein translocase subunit SecG
MLRMALTFVQVFSSVAIVALVLIQRGKGADAGAGFGAGASGTVFGARGARTALSRATAVFAAVFMLNSLALAYMGTQSAAKPTEAPKSLLSEKPVSGEPAPAPTGSLSSVPVPSQDTAPAPAPAPQVEAPATAPPPSGGTPPPQ